MLLSEQAGFNGDDTYEELRSYQMLDEFVSRVLTEAANNIFDKNGKLKKITQNDIDILSVEAEKIDSVDEELRQEYLNTFKEFSDDVFLISAATKENIKPFLSFVMQKVDEIPKPEFKVDIEEDFAATDNDDSDYAVYKIDKNTYSVEGGKLIRLANVTDTRNIDQLYRFQNILAAMNVYEALKQAGIKEGDVVKIGHIQFDYYD